MVLSTPLEIKNVNQQSTVVEWNEILLSEDQMIIPVVALF